METERYLFRSVLLSTVGAVFLFAQPVWAARLLQVYIEKDGNVVAHTYYDDDGRADGATVWRYLGDPPIMVDDVMTAVQADANNPLAALLEGDVLVKIQHTDRVIAQSQLSTLVLRQSVRGVSDRKTGVQRRLTRGTR